MATPDQEQELEDSKTRSLDTADGSTILVLSSQGDRDFGEEKGLLTDQAIQAGELTAEPSSYCQTIKYKVNTEDRISAHIQSGTNDSGRSRNSQQHDTSETEDIAQLQGDFKESEMETNIQLQPLLDNIKQKFGVENNLNLLSVLDLPEYITTLSSEKVQLYLNSMKSGVGIYRHIRVVLIGYEGVGKTTLCKRIIGDREDLDKVTSTDGANLYIQRFWVDQNTKQWKEVDGDLADQVVSRLKDVVASYPSRSSANLSAMGYEDIAVTCMLKSEDNTGDKSKPMKGKNQDVPSEGKKTIDYELAQAVVDGAVKDEPTNTVYASLWDFAGQKDYYCTHHCFLSADAVYLVVFNASHCQNEEECDRLLYWLRSLKTYSIPTKNKTLTPPVILVGTHEDKIQAENPEELFYEFVNNELTNKDDIQNINISCSILLNTKSDSEEKFDKLRDTILEAAPHQDQWGKQIPAKWLELEREIMKKKAANTKIMALEEIKELSSQLHSPIETEEELKMFLGYLHASRTLIYFGESGILESQVIIDPQWLVDAFCCLIKSESFVDKSRTSLFKEWQEFRRTAKLTKGLCKVAWDKSDFQRYSEELIIFMERFGLIASPLIDTDDDNCHDHHCDFFFVPSLFEEPDFKCLELFSNDENVVMSKSLCFVIDYNFVPIEIYDRVIAGCISHLRMTQSAGKRYKKCVQRGFGFFRIDAMWDLIVLCQRSVISLMLFNESNLPCNDNVIGTKIRHMIESILKSTLKMNRQGQLSFDYAFHCEFQLDADDQPIFLKDALEYIDKNKQVRCCRDKKKAKHFLCEHDIHFWGFPDSRENKSIGKEDKIALKECPLSRDDADRINKNWTFLLDNIKAVDLMDAFVVKKIFSIDDTTEIRYEKTPKQQNRVFLEKLCRSAKGAYQVFIDELNKTNNGLVVKVLQGSVGDHMECSLNFECKERITENWQYLLGRINAEYLMDKCLQKGVVGMDDITEIRHEVSTTNKNRLFLEKLCRSGQRAYQVFIDVLNETGDNCVVQKLNFKPPSMGTDS